MKLQVSGRNLDVTEPIREYAERKLARIERHLDRGHARRARAGDRAQSARSAPTSTPSPPSGRKGPVLRAHEYARPTCTPRSTSPSTSSTGRSGATASGAATGGRITRRATSRRCCRSSDADDGGLARGRQRAEPELPIPTIVKTKRFNMKPMHPEEAALQLELVGHEFFVFLNAETDAVAVIYRRRDGNLRRDRARAG